MKSFKYIALLSVILILSSCEKEIDFRYHDIDPIPVIEASLNDQGCDVIITLTTPMDETMNSNRITDANVSILDVNSGVEYDLHVNTEGIFHSSEAGIPGHDYQIIVKIGEETYTSTTRMLSPTEITDASFYWIKMPGDDMAALQVMFTDNVNTEDYYWIRIYRNGEMYSWSVINDHVASEGIVKEVITTTHKDPAQENENQIINSGDEIKVTVTPLNRKLFDYLNAIAGQSNGEPQFEGPVCLGYFIASPVSVSIIKYVPDEIEYAK